MLVCVIASHVDQEYLKKKAVIEHGSTFIVDGDVKTDLASWKQQYEVKVADGQFEMQRFGYPIDGCNTMWHVKFFQDTLYAYE